MKKFILIDHSIKDMGGHYMEYAIRLLESAKEQGYETVLATNADCTYRKSEHIDVIRNSFTHDFWSNYQSEYQATSNKEAKVARKLKLLLDDALHGILNSEISISYQVASQGLRLQEILDKYGMKNSKLRLSFSAIAIGFILRRLVAGLRRIIESRPPLRNAIKALRQASPIRIMAAIASPAILILSPFILAYLLFRMRTKSSLFFHRAQTFSRELRELLSEVNAQKGDIAFVPTLGNIELIGISIYNSQPKSIQVSWKVLFRRNIFRGTESQYSSQIGSQYKLLRAISYFKRQEKVIDCDFYTDTEGLTKQYNALGVLKFKTLPIPMPPNLKKIKKDTGILNVSFIGDARDEKGFHKLGRMVSDLVASGHSNSTIMFRFQSNFNIPGGEPGSKVAKSVLKTKPDLVELFDGPLSSSQYIDRINGSDIILMPYDNNEYYARSSGIFLEAITAGVPAVISDKTWMSREMLVFNQAYLNSLEDRYPPLQEVHLANPSKQSKIAIKLKSPNEFSYLKISVEQFYANPGEYISITWHSQPNFARPLRSTAPVFHEVCIDLSEINSSCLLRLPTSEEIIITLEFLDKHGLEYQSSNTRACLKKIAVLELGVDRMIPLFAGAAIFNRDLDIATAINEIYMNQDSYNRSALEIGNRLKSYHSGRSICETFEAEL